MNDIEMLKSRHALPNIAEHYGVALERSGAGFKGLCPFHPDRNPSFSIYLTAKGEWRFHCFGGACGLHGDVIDFVGLQQYGHGWNPADKEQFKEVLQHLGAENPKAQIARPGKWDLADRQPPTYQQVTPQVQFAWDILLGYYADLLMKTPEVWAYLMGRSFQLATLRRYRFGYCPRDGSQLTSVAKFARIREQTLLKASLLGASDKEGKTSIYEYFRGRIVFADVNWGRQALYVIGRKFPGDELPAQVPKFMGPAGFQKPVFGIRRLTARRGPVFVLEAPWDALTLEQWGFDAVAIAGAHMSQSQIEALLALRRPLVPIKDNDEAGEIAYRAWKEGIPGLQEPLPLPREIDGIAIKDPNDLAKDLPPGVGERIFCDLAKKVPAEPRQRLRK
jgi:DNA primase